MMNSTNEKKTSWMQKILHEMIEYWLIFIYLALFFAVFTIYRRLILAQYQISYQDYGIALIKALVIAKVVLVAQAFRLGRGLEDKSLIFPTVYKTFLFTAIVALFNVIESLIRSLLHGTGPRGAVNELMSRYNYEWSANALLVFFAFIPFFAVRELGRVLGVGTIGKLFFRRRDVKESELTEPKTR
jgi:hypothetical protein